MTNLPFIGRLNTVFIVAIAIGMGIILFTMILNIINSLRARDTEKTWFDTNGLAGLIFYLSLAVTVVLYMTGHALPATAVLIVMFLVPLLLIFFKEPSPQPWKNGRKRPPVPSACFSSRAFSSCLKCS